MFQPCHTTLKFLPVLACILAANISASAVAQIVSEENPIPAQAVEANDEASANAVDSYADSFQDLPPMDTTDTSAASQTSNELADELSRYAEEIAQVDNQPASTYQARSYEPPLALTLISGTPWGTHIDRGRHLAFALTTASPPKFGGTFLTGFSFSERGSILPEYIDQVRAASEAQELANRTRQTVYYTVPYDNDATYGLSLEFLTAPATSLGETPYWFVAKLDNLSYLGSDKNDLDMNSLPITLKWGLFTRVMGTARESSDEIAYSGLTLGFFLDFAFPITRWGQLNAAVNAGLGNPTVEAALSATAHIGNRFFVTAGSNVMEMEFGSFFRAGVRL